MKRLFLSLSILLISSMVVIAQDAEKLTKYQKFQQEQKAVFDAEYASIKTLIENEDWAGAEAKYVQIEQKMKQSLQDEQKFANKAKNAEEKAAIERRIQSKKGLMQATQKMAQDNVAWSEDGKALSVYIMEFAFASQH